MIIRIFQLSLIVFYSFFTGGYSGKRTMEEIASSQNSDKIPMPEAVELSSVFSEISGQPLYYKSEFTTPVCLTGECKLVNIRMYWDLFGNFLKYEMPENETLTKKNHKPFKPKEYQKLHRILSNPTSNFRNIDFNALTEKQVQDTFYDIDAISGATVNHDNLEFIHGAIQTTYVLWHVANGDVKETAETRTKEFYRLNRMSDSYVVDRPPYTDDSKFWDSYKKAADSTKYQLLYQLIATDQNLNENLLLDISAMLCKSDQVMASFCIEVLNRQYIQNPEINENILTLLNRKDPFLNQLAINYFLRKKIRSREVGKAFKAQFPIDF